MTDPNNLNSDSKLITALDYLNQQSKLEKQAKELMPYDPNTCTYVYGPIRQTLFACLSCYDNTEENLNGICYSCSIQCHSDHDLVELFTKRDFTCDCGTTRISKNGCCKLRYAPLKNKCSRSNNNNNNSVDELAIAGSDSTNSVTDLHTVNSSRRNSLKEVWQNIPADDIPSSSNQYNQNFKGLFCSCHQQYNPEQETGNMIQCNFGLVCGEEWYHEECILGLKPGLVDRKKQQAEKVIVKQKYPDGVNILDILPEADDEAANTTEVSKQVVDLSTEKEKIDGNANNNTSDDDNDAKQEAGTAEEEDFDPLPLEGFPDLETFEGFICWKCVEKYQNVFDKLLNYKEVCLDPVFHVSGSLSIEDRQNKLNSGKFNDNEGDEEPANKRIKLESSAVAATSTGQNENGDNKNTYKYSIFLKDDYQEILRDIFIDDKNTIKEEVATKNLATSNNDGDYNKQIIRKFLLDHECLYNDDPVYEPPEDDDLKSESGSSIFDLGSRVLDSLPRNQAAEGVQAYEMIRNRLKQFLKPFAENGEIVTEDKIRNFFDGINDEVKK